VENKSTLLHYLVDIVEKNYPDLITFGDELTHCDRAARVSIDVIQKTLRIMDTSLRNLDVDLTNNCNKQQCGEDDLFSEVMTVSILYKSIIKICLSYIILEFYLLLYKC